MRHSIGVLWCGLSLWLAPVARAQRQAVGLAPGFAVSASVDALFLPGALEGRGLIGSLRLAGLNPQGNGVEATIALAALLVDDGGAGALLVDMDYTRGIPLEGPTLLLRGGAGLLVSAGATPTLNGGMSLLIPVSRRFGFRLDATVRSLLIFLPRANLLSVGVGMIALP